MAPVNRMWRALYVTRHVRIFKKVIGDTLKIPSHKIVWSEPLERYGIDSVNIIGFTTALRKDLGDIDSTLFFEYQTVDALVEYFIVSQSDVLGALLGDEHRLQVPGGQSPEIVVAALSVESLLWLNRPLPFSIKMTGCSFRTRTRPLIRWAIVGIAGRYPQAETLSEFWDVLQKGKNCITEIPKETSVVEVISILTREVALNLYEVGRFPERHR